MQGARRGVAGCSADEGHALLAAHVLIYILGFGISQRQQQHLVTGVEATVVTSGTAPTGSSPNKTARGLTASPPAALYLSLAEAARLTGIRLPSVPSSGAVTTPRPGARTAMAAPDPDTSLMMLFEELAELQHTIHDVLLPRMRETNLPMACSAVAQLYQLAAGPTGGSGSFPHPSGPAASPALDAAAPQARTPGHGPSSAAPATSQSVGAQAAAARLLVAEAARFAAWGRNRHWQRGARGREPTPWRCASSDGVLVPLGRRVRGARMPQVSPPGA